MVSPVSPSLFQVFFFTVGLFIPSTLAGPTTPTTSDNESTSTPTPTPTPGPPTADDILRSKIFVGLIVSAFALATIVLLSWGVVWTMNRRNGRFATQFFYSPETVQKLNRRHAMAAAEAEAKGEEVVVDFTLQLDHHPIEEHSRPEKH